MCPLLSSVQLSEWGCAYSEHKVKCQEYSDSVHCIRVQKDHPAACVRLFTPSSTSRTVHCIRVQFTTFEFSSLHLSVCVRGCFLLRDSLASQDPLTPLYHRSYITDTDSSYMTKPNRANQSKANPSKAKQTKANKIKANPLLPLNQTNQAMGLMGCHRAGPRECYRVLHHLQGVTLLSVTLLTVCYTYKGLSTWMLEG